MLLLLVATAALYAASYWRPLSASWMWVRIDHIQDHHWSVLDCSFALRSSHGCIGATYDMYCPGGVIRDYDGGPSRIEPHGNIMFRVSSVVEINRKMPASVWNRVGFYHDLRLVGPREKPALYHRSVVVPYWLIVLPSAAFTGIFLSRRIQRARAARRERSGLCPNCGYDLRACTGRCPECGQLLS